jgi:hypothetical protein
VNIKHNDPLKLAPLEEHQSASAVRFIDAYDAQRTTSRRWRRCWNTVRVANHEAGIPMRAGRSTRPTRPSSSVRG